MKKPGRIPAFTLVALLAAAPLATCLVSVQAHAATAMAPGEDCGAVPAGESPALCSPQVIASSAPAPAEVAPAMLAPDAWGPGPTSEMARRDTHPGRNAGPPGLHPPAWLRHSAFLI